MRKKLDNPTVVQGYLCAKGWAWFYSDGHLRSCTVGRETTFGEATAPASSWIEISSDDEPRLLVVSRNTRIGSQTCRGGGFGAPGGYTTAFYPAGKLKLC